MVAKDIGLGSVLTVSTSTAGNVEIAQITNISGPGTDATDIDTTTLDSSSNFRTFVAGPIDPGTLTLGLVYGSTVDTHKRLARYHGRMSVHTWKLYHGSSTGDTDEFSGYVKSLSREVPFDGLITADVSIKVTGKPGYST